MFLPETFLTLSYYAAGILTIGYIIYCYLQAGTISPLFIAATMLIPMLAGVISATIYGRVEIEPKHIAQLEQVLTDAELLEFKELVSNSEHPVTLGAVEGFVSLAERRRNGDEGWPERRKVLVSAFPSKES